MEKTVAKKDDLEAALRTVGNMLGYADRSKKKLYERLVQKGYSQKVAAQAVAHAVQTGLLCEARSAQVLAEYLAQTQWYGPRRIAQALYQKGYGREVIDGVDLSQIDFADLCRRRIERFCAREVEALRQGGDDRIEAMRLRKKILSHALRYGFSSEEIRYAMEELEV